MVCTTPVKTGVDKFRPGINPLHLAKEHALASVRGDNFETGGGKADLFHVRFTSHISFDARTIFEGLKWIWFRPCIFTATISRDW